MNAFQPIFSMLATSAPWQCFFATDAHSPSLDVFGSYFPAWMPCIVSGLVLTIIVRLLLIGFGISAYLRPKALVYPCMMILFTLAVWLVFFKN
ncbi:MAG TPA: YtcA family lipoprotein [Candidatus Baltobacteraceae bacterium]|nr:YtcA family lipoprotein [Candidatus Baltobacteraceae bacterium]